MNFQTMLTKHKDKILSSKRILILGSPGSGKSTLALKLNTFSKIDLYHMDNLYWNSDWRRPKNDEWKGKLNEIVKKDNWILDGNYYNCLEDRLPYADLVIYLEVNPIKCLYRYSIRSIYRWINSKSAKFNINVRFILKILLFKVITKPKVFKLVSSYNITSLIFHS